MSGHDLIVIGASAGGIEALLQIIGELPAELPAAICAVLHLPPHGASVLPSILTRRGALPAVEASDGMPLERGRIYLAPPDRHLLVKRDMLRVTAGPRENGFRPAADPLFRTAALAYGPRVIGMVLSGALDDGTIGLALIKRHGGIAVVQDPRDAVAPGMPQSAIEHVKVDYIAPVREIPELLAQLVREEARTTGGVPVTDDDVDNAIEADMAEMDASAFHHNGRPGQPSGFGCPDCGGALYVLSTGDLVHYRCRVGHAWSPDSLLAEQDDQLEAALWTALRALEESSALSSQLAQRLRDRGSHSSAKRFEEQARQAHVRAEVIRRVLSSDGEHHTLTQAEDFVETPEHEAAAVTEHRRHSA